MLNVFQKFQFTVGPLRQDRRAEGLHDLLHCDGDACKLVLCGTVGPIFSEADKYEETITDQTRPNAPEKKGENQNRRRRDSGVAYPFQRAGGQHIEW